LADPKATTTQKVASVAMTGLGFVSPGGGAATGTRAAGQVLTKADNLTPPGAGRTGAFNEAKRRNDVPTSRQPDRTVPNRTKQGKIVPGRQYEFDMEKGRKVIIRDDAKGHFYGTGSPDNRGPHFNDQNKNHFNYGP
jgi:filamentous hemagglutinin